MTCLLTFPADVSLFVSRAFRVEIKAEQTCHELEDFRCLSVALERSVRTLIVLVVWKNNR